MQKPVLSVQLSVIISHIDEYSRSHLIHEMGIRFSPREHPEIYIKNSDIITMTLIGQTVLTKYSTFNDVTKCVVGHVSTYAVSGHISM